MNREVEERIVAMYFDNKDFESNAKKTIDTLGQLKEGLDLEDSVKGFDTLDKAGKQLNLSRATQTVRTFKESVSGMQKIVKKAFDFGTAPLQPLINLFNTFEDYTKKFLGFDLAGKFVNKVEGMVHALTTAPISSGWNMYQQNIDSLQTILSGTKLSYTREMKKADDNWTYSEAEHLDYVKRNLEDLTEYANKTVYSLQDMTSNVGKFTNQGVDLQTAVRSMEGIANATAKAGQGAQQASMAMYNISQAIGVGKMTSIDWKSIENANIATEELKDTFIETAAAAGQLVKEVDKDGKVHYWTVDEQTRKKTKKSMEVTAENFRETLSKGWLDKETMLRTFAIFSGDAIDVDTLKSWGLDDEQIDKFTKMGQEAMKAATEVRTFDKMMDALGESVQAGWAKSFEYIIGDVKEATQFWTSLNNILDGVLGGMTERRNEILLEWRGLEKDEEGNLKRIKGIKDGREDLVMGFFQIVYLLRDIGSMVSGAWTSVFGGLTGSKLREITEGFKNFAFALRNWFGVAGQSGTRLEKIQKGLKGLFSILKLVINRMVSGVKFALKFLEPLTDIFIDLFSTVFGFFDGIQDLNPVEIFVKIGEGLSDLWQKIKNFFRPSALGGFGASPFVKAITDVWNTIKNAVNSWASDVGLDGLVVFFQGIYEGAKEAWEQVVGWFQEIGLADFFNNFWEWLKSIGGGAVDIAKSVGDATKTGIVVFINAISSAISTAWTDLEKWFSDNEVGERIKLFGTNALEWLKSLPSGAIDLLGGVSQTAEDIGLVKFINGIGKAITDAWNSVESFATDERTVAAWKSIASFTTDSFKWISEKLSGIGIDIDFNEIGGMFPDVSEIGFVKFLNDISGSFTTAWDTVEGWFSSGEDGTTPLMFFTDTWGWIKAKFGLGDTFFLIAQELLNPSGFEQFLETITDSLDGPWKEIIAWFTADAGVKGFLADTYNWITTTIGDIADFFVNSEEGNKPGFVLFLESIVDFFTSAWNSIKSWFDKNPVALAIRGFLGNFWGWLTTTYEEVSNFFSETSPVTGKTQFEMVIDSIKDSISTAWSDFVDWLDRLGIIGFFQDAWGWIEDLVNGLFSGEGIGAAIDTSDLTSGIEEGLESTGESISGIDLDNYVHPIVEFVQHTWDSLKELWETGEDAVMSWPGWEQIGNFFSDIWSFIEDAAGQVFNWFTFQSPETGETGFVSFIKEVWDAIKTAWNAIVGWEGWASIGTFFADMFAGDWDSADEDGAHAAEAVERVEEPVKEMVQSANTIDDLFSKANIFDRPEEEKNIFERIFGFLGEVFDKILEIAGASELVDSFTTILAAFKELFEVAATLFKYVADILHDIVVNKNVGRVFELLIEYVGIMLAAKGLPALLNRFGKYKDADSLGGNFMKIGIGLWGVAEAMSLISKIPEDKLWQAAGIAIALVSVVTLIVSAIMKKKEGGDDDDDGEDSEKWYERVLSKLITWIGLIGALAVLMALLPEIIRAIGESKASGDDVLKTLVGVGALVAIISGIMLLITWITSKIKAPSGSGGEDGAGKGMGGLVKVMAIIMAGIVVITAFITGLGLAIEAIGADKILSAIGTFQQTVEAIADAIGGFLGKLVGGLFRPIVEAFTEPIAQAEIDKNNARMDNFMDNMSTMVDKFGGDFLYDMALMMNTMQHFSEQMDDDKIKVLGDFGTMLVSLGDGLHSFYMNTRVLQNEPILAKGRDLTSGELIAKWKTPLEMITEVAAAINPLVQTFSDLAKNMPQLDGPGKYETWRSNVFTFIKEMLLFLYKGMGFSYTDLGISDISEMNALENSGKMPLLVLFEGITEQMDQIEPLMGRLKGVFDMITGDLALSIKDKFESKDLTVAFYDTMMAGLTEGRLQFDATPVIDAIITALGLGESAIAMAIHDLVQNGFNLLGAINGKELEFDNALSLDAIQNVLPDELKGKNINDILGNSELLSQLAQFTNGGGLAGVLGVDNFEDLLGGMVGGNGFNLSEAAGFDSFITKMFGVDNIDDIGGKLSELTGVLEDNMPDMETILKDHNILDLNDLYNEDGTINTDAAPLVGQLTDYIEQVKTAIGAENMNVEIKVVPVVDLTNWPTEKEKLNGLEAQLPYGMARGFISMPETQFGLGDAQKLIELRSLNDRVERTIQTIVAENTKTVNAVYSMGQRIDGLSRTMAGMRLYLDTGLLVGGITPYIDQRMAQKQWIYGRTGVVSLEK